VKSEELIEIDRMKHLPEWCKKLDEILEKYEKRGVTKI